MDGRMGESRVRAAQLVGYLGVQRREALHVQLVDDRLVQRDLSAAGRCPSRSTASARPSAAASARCPPRSSSPARRTHRSKQLGDHCTVALDRARVGVEQELGGVAAQTLVRRPRSVDAVAVALPGADRREVRVPVRTRRPLRGRCASSAPSSFEQAELDALEATSEKTEASRRRRRWIAPRVGRPGQVSGVILRPPPGWPSRRRRRPSPRSRRCPGKRQHVARQCDRRFRARQHPAVHGDLPRGRAEVHDDLDVTARHDEVPRRRVTECRDPVEVGVVQRRVRPAQGEQLAIPVQHPRDGAALSGLVPAAGSDPAKVEACCGSGTSSGSQPRGRTRARRPSLHGGAERGVVVIGEVEERRRGRPLLALEQQGHERRGELQGGGDPQPAGRSARPAAPPWPGCRSGRGSANRPRKRLPAQALRRPAVAAPAVTGSTCRRRHRHGEGVSELARAPKSS